MATFSEIQTKLRKFQSRREVLLCLVEYLDKDFRVAGGAKDPKKLLLITGTRDYVSQEDIETASADLAEEVADLDKEIQKILSSNINEGK